MPELNREQSLAAVHGEGPLLVVAGPGTGKTRVITERIVHLLSGESGFSPLLVPENILALTFTEKAAGEMKQRVAQALPGLETAPVVSTFHAFCLQILRLHHQDRLLLDKIDVWIFLRRRMAQLGISFYQKLAEPGAFLHDLNEFFSRCQDELIEPDDFNRYVEQCERDFRARYPGAGQARQPNPAEANLEWEEIQKKKELAHVFHASRRLIEESGSSSLGSLVSETVSLWRRDPAALGQARSQHRAILVDEFQDTNYAQVELLKLLAPPPCSITAVGDDDQAIYRFRGASHGAFAMFGQAFPGHSIVYLSRNYRSTRKILRAAGTVIARNDRYAEKPALSSQNPEGCPVFLLKAKTPEDEAAWVADEIERIARKGTAYGSMAVLYRAHHYRDLLAQTLGARGVPLSIRGLSILSAPILRDVIAWLRVIHSPHDNISLTRVMLAPCWRIPESAAQRVRDRASRGRMSLYDALTRDPEAVDGIAAGGWDELHKVLKTFRRLARSSTVAGLAAKLADRLGWPAAAGAVEQRYLETFQKFLSEWEEKSETRRLAEFIDYFNYFLEAGGKIDAPESRSNAVQMMTVHAAKGLEFPVVFVIGVSPRRFPATDRKPVIGFPPALRKGPVPPKDIHLQEERRLFFVALTRAKERLLVSSVSKSERQQSVFIQDLLSDPAVRARDVEIIEAPECEPSLAPAAMQNHLPPAVEPKAPFPGGAPRQGSLFEGEKTGALKLHAAIAEWAASAAPESAYPADGKLRLSATACEDYLSCPLKYKFQHVLKIPAAPQAALTFGNLMHAGVRHYFELRRERAPALPAFEDIERFYAGRWISAGYDDEYQEETYRQAGLDQLRGFVEKHNALAIDPARVQMEKGFEMELDGIVLEGRIDQIEEIANHGGASRAPEVDLLDYKTGRARTVKDAEKSLQLSVYALAAKSVLGLRPARVTLYNLTTNEAVSAARTPQDLEEAVEKIYKAAADILARRFPAAPGFICRWCHYQPICPAHEG